MEWISIHDQLPPKAQKVLCLNEETFDMGDSEYAPLTLVYLPGVISGFTWWKCGIMGGTVKVIDPYLESSHSKITHWMPVPERPNFYVS